MEMGSASYPHNGKSATPGQLKYLAHLWTIPAVPAPVAAGVKFYLEHNRFDFRTASETIDLLKKFDKSTAVLAEDRIYKDPGRNEYYKVTRSRSSNNLYALALIQVFEGKKGDDGNWIEDPEFTWEYRKGLISRIRPDWRLTAEQAKAFGDLWSVCIRCHTKLTKQESIDRGLGPVCVDKV